MIPAHSLLSLAISCRFLREIIIPHFLFHRVAFRSRPAAVVSFYGCTRKPAVCHVVRHLTISIEAFDNLSHAYRLFTLTVDIMKNLPNLRSANLIDLENAHSFEWRIAHTLVALPHLRHLLISNCYPDTLEQISALTSLQSLTISISANAPSHSQGFPVENLLINSRATLEDIHLSNAELDFSLLTWKPSATQPRLVWPHVHTLRLIDVLPGLNLDLARPFPSVDDFASSDLAWDNFPNRPFIARLRSFEGTWEGLGLVKATNTALCRAVVHDVLDIQACLHDWKQCLPPNLRSFRAKFRGESLLGFLGELGKAVPRLTYLDVDITLTSPGFSKLEQLSSNVSC
ncbi:hypothetical protein BOTBODRAFT_183733, partial [Botryobasidium botryosum FD-172 SS1]